MTIKEANAFWDTYKSLGKITKDNVENWEVLVLGLVGKSFTIGTPALGEEVHTITIMFFNAVERIATIKDASGEIYQMSMCCVLNSIGTFHWNFIIEDAA